MRLIEKQDQRIFFSIYDTSGDPKLGLIYSDISMRIAKSNATEFTLKTLSQGSGGNFGELGFGMYYVDLVASDVDVLGQFAVCINGATIDTKHMIYEVVPQEITATADLPSCVVFGTIKDLGGIPSDKPVRVVAQILRLPDDSNDFISTKIKETYTDESGLFKITLVIGATVRIEISDASVRRQFVVPNLTTVNLKDLPLP